MSLLIQEHKSIPEGYHPVLREIHDRAFPPEIYPRSDYMIEKLKNSRALIASMKDKVVGFSIYGSYEEDKEKCSLLESFLYARLVILDIAERAPEASRFIEYCRENSGREVDASQIKVLIPSDLRLLAPDRTDIHLSFIAVNPDYQNQGIGSAMMAKIVKQPGKKYLFSRKETESMQRLMQKFSFSLLLEHPFYQDGSSMQLWGKNY